SVGVYSAGRGLGAAFTVLLPLARAAEPSPPDTHTREAQAWVGDSARGVGAAGRSSHVLNGLRVCLVDDDEDALQLLSMLLRKHGVEVAAATSAADALLMFEQARPDVFVSDVGMPDVDGYELIRRVRALEEARGGRTPAVALTAYASEADRLLALGAGFDEHLAKPVEPESLLLTIANLAEKIKNPAG
ncbi:MAG: response regulator, partial [Pyrinomonadaceae bacterium]